MAVDPALQALPARRVLIGVAGSIASITVPRSILWLRHELGVEVRVVMTRQAATMVAPRALAVASGAPVALDDTPGHAPGHDVASHNDPVVRHMDLTRWADLFLVLPASANVLAKAAHGIADDLLTTCIIAAACPVVFVPGMNEVMWRKPAVQRNVATLEADGYGVVAPVEGLAVATGRPTVGAMPEIDEVVAWVTRFLHARGAAPAGADVLTDAATLTEADALKDAETLVGQAQSAAREVAR